MMRVIELSHQPWPHNGTSRCSFLYLGFLCIALHRQIKSTTWNRVPLAAHSSVLPPSTTMTSRGGGNRLRRWRTHSAMHRASFSAWRALRRYVSEQPRVRRRAHG